MCEMSGGSFISLGVNRGPIVYSRSHGFSRDLQSKHPVVSHLFSNRQFKWQGPCINYIRLAYIYI